jgi:drug/metabolite transporter (DMT)-like permease
MPTISSPTSPKPSIAPSPTPTDGHRRLGAAMLVTVVLAWGITWPVNKVLLETLPPLWLSAMRSGIGAVALVLLSLALGALAVPRRADVPVLLSITLLHMVGFVVLTAFGLSLVPTGRSVVLAYTTPLWVAPGARLFLGEPLTGRRIIGVAVGLLGLVVLFNPLAFDWADRDAVLGNLAILAAALLWAASIVHVRGHRWHATPFALLPWEMLLATLILAPLAYLAEPLPPVAWDVRLTGLLLYASLPGSALAYWAVATAGRHLPAVTTSLGLLATPVVSIVVATLWLGEPPTASLIVAVVLILGGVALGATGDRAPIA